MRHSSRYLSRGFWLRATALVAVVATVAGCRRGDAPGGAAPVSPADVSTVRILFAYGSEKQKWVDDVVATFNRSDARVRGRRIAVEAVPMGSGELVDEILAGRLKAHVASPASKLALAVANASSRAATGRDLVGPTESLVVSPVVIAMWRPMAEALGWGKRPIGWKDILELARDERGWAARGRPEWGPFRFGHTHPQYSNSGLAAVLAAAYAAAGKTASLTVADVARPGTAELVGGIERAVVHYGSSTGFFGRTMFAEGPSYLSAAVLYESMVAESARHVADLRFPVVAIYPSEGTFWSDHPVGIVDRDWVTAQQREAAGVFIAFLLARPQQERALQFGFRPADVSIPLGPPIDRQLGVDPAEPKTTLEVPSVQVVEAVLALWQKSKKHADIVLALDTSGSMEDDDKLPHAVAGAGAFVDLLDAEDRVSILRFDDRGSWVVKDQPAGQGRDALKRALSGLIANGGTAMYDAVSMAVTQVRSGSDSTRIKAVVVLTDGDDKNSAMRLDRLVEQIGGRETGGVRVFTIGYGKDARQDVLDKLAGAGRGRYYKGSPETIREVFRDISTFF